MERRLNMSFNGNKSGVTYAPGYFLAHEECKRETRTIPQSLATTAENGTKYVKAGTIYPANDATAEGIVYEDVDVTTGAMPGSVVTAGFVIPDSLPVAPVTAAGGAMKNITMVEDSSVTRPYTD
jgi:hypothetical protein